MPKVIAPTVSGMLGVASNRFSSIPISSVETVMGLLEVLAAGLLTNLPPAM